MSSSSVVGMSPQERQIEERKMWQRKYDETEIMVALHDMVKQSGHGSMTMNEALVEYARKQRSKVEEASRRAEVAEDLARKLEWKTWNQV